MCAANDIYVQKDHHHKEKDSEPQIDVAYAASVSLLCVSVWFVSRCGLCVDVVG